MFQLLPSSTSFLNSNPLSLSASNEPNRPPHAIVGAWTPHVHAVMMAVILYTCSAPDKLVVAFFTFIW